MTTDLSKYDANQLPSADVLGRQRYAIVVADWNSEITYAMTQGAIDTFVKHGVPEENIDVLHVPGTVELTYGAARIIKEERIDAVFVHRARIGRDTARERNHPLPQTLREMRHANGGLAHHRLRIEPSLTRHHEIGILNRLREMRLLQDDLHTALQLAAEERPERKAKSPGGTRTRRLRLAA